MEEQKTAYYHTQDDGIYMSDIKTKTVDKDFDYERKGIGNWLLRNVFVRCIVFPILFVFRRFATRTRFVGRKKLSKHKGGCFVYANHTEVVPEAFRLVIAPFPHKPYVIVHPNNVSVPGLQPLMMAFGCIPIPTESNGMRNFMKTVKKRAEKHPVFIFPERIIWPYYTKIRDFTDVSFHYPVAMDKPVFVMTTTFHKSRLFKKPSKIVYIDGPFYPDESLPSKERQKELCRVVREKMCERAALTTYEYVRYVQLPPDVEITEEMKWKQ